MKTAFRGAYSCDKAGPNIAILCEYGALPSIGHACGHNLISELGIAAGLGIKAAMTSSDQLKGKVSHYSSGEILHLTAAQ